MHHAPLHASDSSCLGKIVDYRACHTFIQRRLTHVLPRRPENSRLKCSAQKFSFSLTSQLPCWKLTTEISRLQSSVAIGSGQGRRIGQRRARGLETLHRLIESLLDERNGRQPAANLQLQSCHGQVTARG